MNLFSTPTLSWIALFALVLTYSDAHLVNFTIDDTEPDSVTGNTFSYAPNGRWNQGNGCADCSARPDPSLVLDGTWHDATYSNNPSQNEVQTARVDFNGSAIYVFGILWQEQLMYTVDMSFFIDGQLVGGFTYVPPGLGSYIYNVPLYANSSIGDGTHSFELQNGRAGGATSLVLFDYIIYSQNITDPIPPSSMIPTASSSIQTPTPSPSTSSGLQMSSSSGSGPSAAPAVAPSPAAHRNNTRTVVIASVVPSILLLAAIGLWLMWRRRARDSYSDDKDTIGDIDAFHIGEPSSEGEQQAQPADSLPPSPPERYYGTGHVGAQSAIEGLSSGLSMRSGDSKAPPPYDSLSS